MIAGIAKKAVGLPKELHQLNWDPWEIVGSSCENASFISPKTCLRIAAKIIGSGKHIERPIRRCYKMKGQSRRVSWSSHNAGVEGLPSALQRGNRIGLEEPIRQSRQTPSYLWSELELDTADRL